MKEAKKLGIWMDHAHAHLMEFTTESITSNKIDSTVAHAEKDASLGSSESQIHNKEQYDQSAYYKKLEDAIKGYDEVLLFGPTEAKDELYNKLKADHRFANIKIETKTSDKISEGQQHAFVNEYFSK